MSIKIWFAVNSRFPNGGVGGCQFYGHWSKSLFLLEEVCVAVTPTQSQALQLTAMERLVPKLKLRT